MTLCPHCNQPTEAYIVSCDGHPVEAHRCRAHGDVVPRRYPIPDPCQIPEMRRSEDPGSYQVNPPDQPGRVWDGEGP